MLNPKIEIKMIQASRLPLNDHYPDSFRQKVLDLLKSRNIEVLLNEKADLDAISGTGRVNLRSGKTLTADVVVLPKLILCSLNQFVSTGPTPNGEIIKTLSPALYNPATHSIRVKGTLQVDDDAYPNIFAAGDVADTPDLKMAYKASLHVPVIVKNIKSLLKDQTPTAIYKPSTAEMVCLPLGKDGGITFIPYFGGCNP
jgi:apoptosis-inducing factor 2